MKTQVILHIHSFVDLITNSSSETFVSASASSVKTVKELVDNLFAVSGAKQPLKADEVFDFAIVNKYNTRDYDEVFWTKAEYLEDQKLGKKSKCDPEENTEDGYASGDGQYTESKIRVTLKDGPWVDLNDTTNAATAKAIAETLSNLEGLFNYESTYNS